jgi:hypothetical protein
VFRSEGGKQSERSDAGVMMVQEVFGIAFDAFFNVTKEFWQDLRNKLFKLTGSGSPGLCCLEHAHRQR